MRGVVQSVFILMVLAGLYFGFRRDFKYVMFLSLVAGNFFCGWICPYGILQEVFGKIGDRIFKKKYKIPYGIQKYLQCINYFKGVNACPVKDTLNYGCIIEGRAKIK